MNRMKKIGWYLLPILLLALTMSSCKTSKKALKRPLKKFGFEYLYSKMKEEQVKTDYFSAKLNLIISQEKSKSDLKGILRMKKDSIIWLSISPALGIEVLRVEMTQDSVKVINRLNKTYLAGNYQMVEKLVNTTIDYSIVEALLLGNDLSQYNVKKYKVKIDNGMYNISIRKRRKLKRHIKKQETIPLVLIQDFWIDPHTFRIRKMKLHEFGDNSKSLNVYYNNYGFVDGQQLPFSINIDIFASNNLSINVKYRKPNLVKPLKFPFRIPSKYKEMQIND